MEVSPATLKPQENIKVTVNFNSDLAWSEIQGNVENTGTVYFVRNDFVFLWETFNLTDMGEIHLQGALPEGVGAGDWQVVVDIPIINQREDRSDNTRQLHL